MSEGGGDGGGSTGQAGGDTGGSADAGSAADAAGGDTGAYAGPAEAAGEDTPTGLGGDDAAAQYAGPCLVTDATYATGEDGAAADHAPADGDAPGEADGYDAGRAADPDASADAADAPDWALEDGEAPDVPLPPTDPYGLFEPEAPYADMLGDVGRLPYFLQDDYLWDEDEADREEGRRRYGDRAEYGPEREEDAYGRDRGDYGRQDAYAPEQGEYDTPPAQADPAAPTATGALPTAAHAGVTAHVPDPAAPAAVPTPQQAWDQVREGIHS